VDALRPPPLACNAAREPTSSHGGSSGLGSLWGLGALNDAAAAPADRPCICGLSAVIGAALTCAGQGNILIMCRLRRLCDVTAGLLLLVVLLSQPMACTMLP